jgi:signal transduction histidine kinase
MKGLEPEKVPAYWSFSDFNGGSLLMVTLTPPADISRVLLRKFADVFGLAYRRFVDLKQAEAQAREAQIEAALERVRARAMAMHTSEELKDVGKELRKQIGLLGQNELDTCVIQLYDESPDYIQSWAAMKPSANNEEIREFNRAVPKKGLLIIEEALQAYSSGRKDYILLNEKTKLKQWMGFMKETYPDIYAVFIETIGLEPEKVPTYWSCSDFNGGSLMMATLAPPAEISRVLLRKFANVFGLAYRRFVDIRQAEAQAREAQIELALERVRARTMAMQKSDELNEVAALLFQQVKNLGIKIWTTGFKVWSDDNNFFTDYVTNPVGGFMEPYTMDSTQYSVFVELSKAKKRGDDFFVNYEEGEQLAETYGKLSKYGEKQFKAILDSGFQFPSKQYEHHVFGSKVSLLFITYEPVPEAHDIFKRFGKVFEQTYTRFLDLQKAEAQAREARIEAALEKVRSRSLAMHKSDELKEVITVVLQKLQEVGVAMEGRSAIIAVFEEGVKEFVQYVASPEHSSVISDRTPYFDTPIINDFWGARVKGESLYTKSYSLQEKNEMFNYCFEHTELRHLPENEKRWLLEREQYETSVALEKHSAVIIANWTASPLTEENHRVFQRFAKVFDQAYVRFLDLQKAEAQAREAKIEAALEKVRARAMAMHKSDELLEAGELLFNELSKLGIESLTAGYVLMDEEGKLGFNYTANSSSNKIPHPSIIPHNETKELQNVVANWKKQERFYVVEMNEEETIKHQTFVADRSINFPLNAEQLIAISPKRLFLHNFYFKQGYLLIVGGVRLSDQQLDVMLRFTNVFQQTYTRFLDLKKAEASEREAKIEAALEKVRARAMAMHNSNDLASTASMVFTELRKLGITPIRCGVGILKKESRRAQLFSATSSAEGDSLALIGWVMLQGHPVLENIYETWLKNEDYYPELSGEQLHSYYQLLLSGLSVTAPDPQAEQKQYGHFFPFSVGCLYAWSDIRYTDSETKILKRFAAIIDLTFRRYIELQKSEANAREAVKQAALDRVRADIASMRTITDLDRITPLIWNELTILGVPFIRCGVFIMDDTQQLIHTFLSTPKGEAIAAFHLPYATPGNMARVLTHWQHKKIYTEHWDEKTFTEFSAMLVEQGALASPEQYLSTLPHGGFYLHFLPFLQGMLYVGNTTQLGEDEMRLVQSVADAFSTAYARYEDFNKLEMAKQQIELTLSELKATQSQLIQKEKMASLGELTAGIAHEIQNPLNFVNNFSEVSTELVNEIEEALQKDDKEEALIVASNIKENLEKINHHGKRADAIVKGMLQHSRASTGKKEPTDINALVDEYVRLAYHGLRAKDKDFNAAIETNFDEGIGKIEVVPQDLGRVLLNLFNNAFYAVSARHNAEGKSFKPVVKIETKKVNSKVEVVVQDNGNGIPQNMIDKIFQPFFTTKPTGQGTGLGLSLSYDIIKAHGGEIKVVSKEGEGSEFIIVIPTNK